MALFPFKAYILGVPVVALLSVVVAELAGWSELGGSWNNTFWLELSNRLLALEYGLVVCIVGLLLGSNCLLDRKARRAAAIFAIVGIVVAVLVYPATLPQRTK